MEDVYPQSSTPYLILRRFRHKLAEERFLFNFVLYYLECDSLRQRIALRKFVYIISFSGSSAPTLQKYIRHFTFQVRARLVAYKISSAKAKSLLTF